MRCPVKRKPILDLSIYSKNRCWRVPGSTKGAEWPGENESLPEMDFFMQTRMSDRQGSPTFSARELAITKERHRKRKLNPSTCPRPHTRANGQKKRGRKWMISGDSRASTCKRRNHRQALTTSAVSSTGTPGPDPGPSR